MTVVLDPLLCVIFSGVMFFCSGFASYGCYRCYTDMVCYEANSFARVVSKLEIPTKDVKHGSKVVPDGNGKGCLKTSKERYRLRLFKRRPSTTSSDATIYSVHSSEIWSRRSSPGIKVFSPSPSPSAHLRAPTPTAFLNTAQIRGWTIKEEPEEENNENRRNSAPT